MPTASRRSLITGAAASLGAGLTAAREPLAEIEARVGGVARLVAGPAQHG
jgi:hypothetical protein